jgi:hypothetical protein
MLAALALSTLVAVTVAPARPLHVTTCDPRPGYVSAGGFIPAYYPGGPYYWRDIYGYRYLQPPVVNNPTLAIDYVNQTSVAANVIEFGLVAKGVLVAEVRDVGTFSPGAPIKHSFGLDPNVFPLGTALARCVPLYIKFADGSHWTNPNLPELRRSIYHQ